MLLKTCGKPSDLKRELPVNFVWNIFAFVLPQSVQKISTAPCELFFRLLSIN
jgi:hypothetical protein